MPTIHDLKQSRFLTKGDVTPPKLATICGYKYENIAMEGEAADNQYLLQFQEFEKPLVLKPVNGDLIAMALGTEDLDSWIGKQIVLFVDPTVAMKGKVVGGIRCRAPKVKTAPAAPTSKVVLPMPPTPKPVAQPEPAEPESDDVPF